MHCRSSLYYRSCSGYESFKGESSGMRHHLAAVGPYSENSSRARLSSPVPGGVDVPYGEFVTSFRLSHLTLLTVMQSPINCRIRLFKYVFWPSWGRTRESTTIESTRGQNLPPRRGRCRFNFNTGKLCVVFVISLAVRCHLFETSQRIL